MLRGDVRGWRIALVADAVANPEAPGALDVLGPLVEAEYGVVVPPPDDFALTTIGRTIEHIVDDLADYHRNGYRVVCIGSSARPGDGYWRALVDAELAGRGIGLDRFDVVGATADELAAFIAVPAPAQPHPGARAPG